MHLVKFKRNNNTTCAVFFDENAFEFFTPHLTCEETSHIMQHIAAEITEQEATSILYVRHILQYQEKGKMTYDVYMANDVSFNKRSFCISEAAKTRKPESFQFNTNDVPHAIKDLLQREYIKNNTSAVKARAVTLLDEKKTPDNAKLGTPPAPPSFNEIEINVNKDWNANPESIKQELRRLFGDRFESIISRLEQKRDDLLDILNNRHFEKLHALEAKILALKEGAPKNSENLLNEFVSNRLIDYKIPDLLKRIKEALETEKSRLESFSAPAALNLVKIQYIAYKRHRMIITHVNHLLLWALYSKAQPYFDSIKHLKDKRDEFNRHFAPLGLAANESGKLPTLEMMYAYKLGDKDLQTANLNELRSLLNTALSPSKNPCATLITEALAIFDEKIAEHHHAIARDTPAVEKPKENQGLVGVLTAPFTYSAEIAKTTFDYTAPMLHRLMGNFNIWEYIDSFSQSLRLIPQGEARIYKLNPFSWKDNIIDYVDANHKIANRTIDHVCQHSDEQNYGRESTQKLTNQDIEKDISRMVTTVDTETELQEAIDLMQIIDERLTKKQAPREARKQGKTTFANIRNPDTKETLAEQRIKALKVPPQPTVSITSQAENVRVTLQAMAEADQLLVSLQDAQQNHLEATEKFSRIFTDEVSTISNFDGPSLDRFSEFSKAMQGDIYTIKDHAEACRTAHKEIHDFCTRFRAISEYESVNGNVIKNKEFIQLANKTAHAKRTKAQFLLRALQCHIAEKKLPEQIKLLEEKLMEAGRLIRPLDANSITLDIAPLIERMRINMESQRARCRNSELTNLMEELTKEPLNESTIKIILQRAESSDQEFEKLSEQSRCLSLLVPKWVALKRLQATKSGLSGEISGLRKQASAVNLASPLLGKHIETIDVLERRTNQSAIAAENSLETLSQSVLVELCVADFDSKLSNCAKQVEVAAEDYNRTIDAKCFISQSISQSISRSASEAHPPSPQPEILNLVNPEADNGKVKLCAAIVQIITNKHYWQSKTKGTSLPFFGGKRLGDYILPKHIRLLNLCIESHGPHGSIDNAHHLLIKIHNILDQALQKPHKTGRRTATKLFYPLLLDLTTLDAIHNSDTDRSWESRLEKWKRENEYRDNLASNEINDTKEKARIRK